MERLTQYGGSTNSVYQALSSPKGPGDEASSGADTLDYTPLDMRCTVYHKIFAG